MDTIKGFTKFDLSDDLWDAAGVARLCPAKNSGAEKCWQDVFSRLALLLCKEKVEVDLRALEKECDDVVDKSSKKFQGMVRRQGEKLMTAAARFEKEWVDELGYWGAEGSDAGRAPHVRCGYSYPKVGQGARSVA